MSTGYMGIKCDFECPSCGNILTTRSPFWNDKLRKQKLGPEKCGCGRKGSFRLLTFEPCTFKVEDEI